MTEDAIIDLLNWWDIGKVKYIGNSLGRFVNKTNTMCATIRQETYRLWLWFTKRKKDMSNSSSRKSISVQGLSLEITRNMGMLTDQLLKYATVPSSGPLKKSNIDT